MRRGYQPEEAPENPKAPEGGSGTAREWDEVLFASGHQDTNDRGGYIHVEEEFSGRRKDSGQARVDVYDLFSQFMFPELGKTYRVRVSVRNGAIMFERL